jgi:hypothetical protein
MIVMPCAAHRTAALDQEGRSFRHVLQPAEVVGDAEPLHGVGVPVREELDLAEVERLAPRGLRPRRIARDRVWRDAGLLELRSPVTQELELVRSGRRPGEQEEQEERGAPRDEVGADHRLARSHPDRRIRDGVTGAQHTVTLRYGDAGQHQLTLLGKARSSGARLEPPNCSTMFDTDSTLADVSRRKSH